MRRKLLPLSGEMQKNNLMISGAYSIIFTDSSQSHQMQKSSTLCRFWSLVSAGYLCIFIIFVPASWASSAPIKQEVKIQYGEREIPVTREWLQQENLKPTLETLADPNSGVKTKYEVIPFMTLLKRAKNSLKLNSEVQEVLFETIDGYRLRLSISVLAQENVFYVLSTPELKDHRIFNKSLNVSFDWRPGYILLPKSENSSSSPYQVTQIKLFTHALKNPILEKTPSEFQQGAKIFVKTCSKCHSHLGFGGRKAPKITLLLPRHPEDKELASFLRSPAKTIQRPIAMSPYDGDDKEMAELIKYLRHIQKN